MKTVIFMMLFLCGFVTASPLSESAKVEDDIENGRLAARTEKALAFVIMTAAGELRRRNFHYEADQMETEWFNTYQHSFHAFASGMRDIGDHKPLSQWIADKYNMLEMLLGVDVCKKTHLSDLKTFNFTIPVVFRPCSFNMDAISIPRIDEYRKHFSEGDVYYGLVPVVTYWVVYGATTAATMGGGFVFVAGIAGSLAERLIVMITPKLSDKVYTKACGGV